MTLSRAGRAGRAGLLLTFSVMTLACSADVSRLLEPPTDPSVPAVVVVPVPSETSIDRVAINQGVKVTLFAAGKAKIANAPVIAGRPAQIRVHAIAPTTAPLTAELRIHTPRGDDIVVRDGPRSIIVPKTKPGVPAPLLVDEEEEEEDTTNGATFEFNLAADHINHGASMSVVLRDPNAPNVGSSPRGDGDDVLHFPADGSKPLSLSVAPHAPKLKVQLVPIRYRADGSDRLTPLDAATVASYREGLYKLYPVPDVEIALHDPIDWTLEVQPDGTGWSELLLAVMATRRAERPAANVYYVGVVNPAVNEKAYCKNGCVQGMAPSSIDLVLRDEADRRAALVAGFDIVHTALAQEIAHAMGRGHAPCGNPNAIDGKFPYDDGTIGKVGWDVVKKESVEADLHDFMSYCSPVWVSDYTFKAIHKHMTELQLGMSVRDSSYPMKVHPKLLLLAP